MSKLLETFQELNLSNYGPDDVDQLNAWAIDAYAELSAIKAQEPVAEIALSDDGYKIGLLGALRNHRLPIGTKLYAAPVSEAKAHGNYAPASVVWIDAHHVIEGNNPSFIKDVALVSAERTYETQIPLARLNAAPVQHEHDADGWPKLDKKAMVGGTRFGVGVSTRLVVEAAQRRYEYEVTPEKEKARIEKGTKALQGFLAGFAAPGQQVGVPDGLAAEIERAAKFVEAVRECERLASSYCGTLDGVEEHGGDDHEDPTCAIWHRLYYAMFDGDKVIAELRQLAAAPAAPAADACKACKGTGRRPIGGRGRIFGLTNRCFECQPLTAEEVYGDGDTHDK